MTKIMHKTILVVDDHEDDRMLLRQLFESSGYRVLLAGNGEVAQNILRTQHVDLVFSDVLMPIMDGIQLCKMIKESPELQHIYVILYTSIYSNEGDLEKATKAGADQYLIKPINLETLIGVLEKTLNGGSSRIEQSAKEVLSPASESKEEYLRLYSTQLVKRLEKEVDKLGAEIIKRKKVEQEQKEILSSIVDGVITIDEMGEVLSFNQAAEKLFGYRSKDVIGKNVDMLMPEPYAAQHNHYLKRYKETGEAHNLDVSTGREVVGLRRDRETFPLRLFVTELPRDVNGHQRFIGSCQDLTQIKQQEEQLRRSQKMEALGKLTGGIAHDYNNMLGVVTGYAELLEQALRDQPKLEKYAQQIQHAGQRGAKLTKKLLSFSRQKSAGTDVIDLNSLLLNEQHMLEKTLTARIGLEMNLADDLWPILLDSSELEDAIINICINAMHAIDGSGQLTIQTRNEKVSAIDAEMLNLDMGGDYVVLRIADSGCGMSATIKEKIFDPFYSTKGNKGTGLGLSQVYGFVQRSKGAVKVYSEMGHGTQFTLYFPRHYVGGGSKKQATDADVIDYHGTETILVVDDEPALLSLVMDILSLQGYRVLCANSAKQAQDILAHEPIDLLLSDVIMPEMDGYQLASIVKEKYPDVKIQLASGFSGDGKKNVVDDRLQQNLLVKPYSSQDLLSKIRELLDG